VTLLRDKTLDALIDEITETFAKHMAQEPELVPCYLDLIFVARAFERIGDKSANIAEDAFWRYRAEDIRHTCGAKKD
jgi:phosphate transport system protein